MYRNLIEKRYIILCRRIINNLLSFVLQPAEINVTTAKDIFARRVEKYENRPDTMSFRAANRQRHSTRRKCMPAVYDITHIFSFLSLDFRHISLHKVG